MSQIALSIPFDLSAIEADTKWREKLAWPVSPSFLGDMYRRVLSEYLSLVRGLSGHDQRVAILAMGPIISVAMMTFEVAVYADAEAETGIRVDGHEPEFQFLRSETQEPPEPRMRGPIETIAAPRLPLRRNAQVTSWWTPWGRMAPTLIRPYAVAIGENPLLISSARIASQKISFRHGGLFFRAARSGIPAAAGEGITFLSAMIVEKMLGVIKVSSEIHRRLAALLAINCTPLLAQVSRDLHGLGKIARLPSRVWAGTAADYATRGIGLEVMRRGGSVRRFDHGGTIGMTDYPEVTASLELLATTTHVLPTEKLAANVRSSGASKLLPRDQGLEIIGSDERHPGSVPGLPRPPASSRRKVVYCPTLLLGFRRHAFSTLPDPLSLDWTLRIAEALVEMPIDLLCKPHPEGILRGRAHPVEKIAATSYRPFEEEMAEADIFVFDRCHSTAFWTALITDRPVIYLEATPPAMHPEISEIMERRCKILRASFDDRNRPQIDPAELREAILTGQSRVDPAEVQELLLGKAA